MRTLLTVVIATAMLAGCSDSPDVSDLTEEQLVALQRLGEILKPDAGDERYRAARSTVWAHQEVLYAAAQAYEPSTDEYLEAWAKASPFAMATNNISSEFLRRRKVDGSEKAADWYIEEIKKSDSQIIEEWYTTPPGYDEWWAPISRKGSDHATKPRGQN